MQPLLSQEHQQLLRQERSLLDDIRVQLARLEATQEDLDLLKRSLDQLDELFLLVVVGEFNAGKTAFLNALLGSKHLPEGVTPTTAHIHLLRHGDTVRREPAGDEIVAVYLPVEWLREINLVDTPGTNAIILRHQQITEHFVPQSDLVLFVTSADRPFSESERSFLERIRQWGKKVVIIVNKWDLVESDEDRRTILAFVRENAAKLLGTEPQIFPVSARLAQQAKQAGGNGAVGGTVWEESGFGALESWLLETLDTGERLRLKLENPLGVAKRLLDQYDALLDGRQSVLKSDIETLGTVEEQLAAYEEDMRRDFQYQLSRVDNVIYAMAERGDRFFDQTMRLGRVFDLVNGQKISNEFNREVVADTSRDVERQISDLINWMVDKDYRQWRSINEYLTRRWAQHEDRIVGQVGAAFESGREALLANVGRESQRIIEGYDREAEAAKLGQEVQRSIVQTAAIEASALGLGAILVAVLHTSLLDFTGILSAGALAALGLYLLPFRRSQLKADLRTRLGTLRTNLNEVMTRQFSNELESGMHRIRDAIAPYTRFVRVEREKLDRIHAELAGARSRVESLRTEIERL